MFWLHRYTRLLAATSLVLITAGGLVTSTGTGLSVPDWPNTYGYFMFSFPLSKMVGGIFYEHGHRLIASTVGLLTILLVISASWIEPRRWVRRLSWFSLAIVVTQGILGGITVLYFLPPLVSISHAGLAQIFFVLIVSIAIFTSEGWLTCYGRSQTITKKISGDSMLCLVVVILTAVIYTQILLGATMRHTGAGLAIPDFPLAFGQLIPPSWGAGIALHFSHRIGAVVVASLVVALAGHVLYHQRSRRELVRPAILLLVVTAGQLALGAWTVLSAKHVAVNTAHVTMGAVVFVTSVVLALRVHRDRFSDDKFSTQLIKHVELSSNELPSHSSPGVGE